MYFVPLDTTYTIKLVPTGSVRNNTSGRHVSSRDAAALAWQGALRSSPSPILKEE